MLLLGDFRNVDIKRNVDLFIIDPPYGKVIDSDYDKISSNELVELLYSVLDWCEIYSKKGTTIYMFGCVGNYKNRPFFKFLSDVESNTRWRIHNIITWSKRRGYGTKYNWIFAREEIVMFVYDSKKPSYFVPPYTDEERSDAWKKRLSSLKYKPKQSRIRYTNVIKDIKELFVNKLVTAEKPYNLIKLLIETSCPKDGFIVDPMCGSGITGKVSKDLGIDFLCIEKDNKTFNIAHNNMGLFVK